MSKKMDLDEFLDQYEVRRTTAIAEYQATQVEIRLCAKRGIATHRKGEKV